MRTDFDLEWLDGGGANRKWIFVTYLYSNNFNYVDWKEDKCVVFTILVSKEKEKIDA